ncbi:MAG: cohesin domain-containing protein [Candidatus Poribacteria bacterium]|nr:cohesin domain-containing protein [Candidatus Poribacteria bacterium]
MKLSTALLILMVASSFDAFAGEYATWGLPEGAKWRIGRGAMKEAQYSPDGARLAVASSTGIWLYDTETLSELALLADHTGSVTCVAYSPDGGMLASGSTDMTVRVRDANTGEQKYPPLQHTYAVKSVQFSPDGALLASVSSRQVQIWDADTGAKKRTLTGHTHTVNSVAFSPDGNALVTGSKDGTMRVWNVRTGDCLRTIKGGYDAHSLAISPDGKTLAVGFFSELHLWDTGTWQLRMTRSRDLNRVTSVAFTPDGERVIAGHSEGITLWDTEAGRLQQRLIGPSGGTSGLVFSPDGGTIASVSGDNILRFWDAESGAHLRSLAWMQTGWGRVTFSPDGRILAVGRSEKIRLWDAKSGEHVRTLKEKAHGAQSLAFNWDGNLLASGGHQKVLMWDITTGKLLRTLNRNHNENVLSLAFSRVGETLAGSIGADILLWDTGSGEHLRTLSGHEYEVRNLAFSRDGRFIVSSGNREILLWEFKTGKHLRTFIGFENNEVKDVALSGDGKTLYCATKKELRLWDIDTGEYRQFNTGVTSGNAGAAFSPDGGLLAHWNNRGIVLWNTAKGQSLETLAVDSGNITSAAFSPDGRTLATANRTGSVLVWDIRPPSAAIAAVRLVPPSAPCPPVGEQLTLSLEIENGENVSAYQATVSFDPDALRFVDVADGGYLPQGAFFLPPVVDAHRVTLGAAALEGASHGRGTLTALTFEVAAVKNSVVTLSDASLVDANAKQTFPRLEDARVEKPSRVVVDANGDGVISILDLPQVAARLTEAGKKDVDVNQDGAVDTADLFQAVTDLKVAKTEPGAYLAALSMLTSTDVAEWLDQQRESNQGEADLKRSIRAVQHQLAVTVPGETALLPNYPNPFERETWIPYHLAFKMEVYITIYSEKGLPVRHLAMGDRNPGHYVGLSRAAYWDGRDDDGAPVPSGTYVYELVTWDHMESQKMTKSAVRDKPNR